MRRVVETRVRGGYLLLTALLVALGLILVAIILLWWTPLYRILPDRMGRGERLASQQSIMRIDSLNQVVAHNQVWIDNFSRVTDMQRTTGDSAAYAHVAGEYNPDSLPDASPLEARFVSSMEERERFNISVLAPLDADGMVFSPAAAQSVITSDTRKEREARLVMLADSPVMSIADGTVLAVYGSGAPDGYTVVVQHGRGFVSFYSHLGAPMVSGGDAVNGGQPIAFAPKPDARAARWINLKIWHNGTSLIPADILKPEF